MPAGERLSAGDRLSVVCTPRGGRVAGASEGVLVVRARGAALGGKLTTGAGVVDDSL